MAAIVSHHGLPERELKGCRGDARGRDVGECGVERHPRCNLACAFGIVGGVACALELTYASRSSKCENHGTI